MAEPNTRTNGGSDSFPKTRWTVIREAADPASPLFRESLERLAATYWRPVYVYFRAKWNRSTEDAKDLAQEFFLALTEQGFLATLSPDRGRFRTYVMTALDNFVRLRHRWETRLKRGGGFVRIPMEECENLEPSAEPPERQFRKAWAASVMEEAVDDLERECASEGRESDFRLFALHDLDRPDGEDLSYEGLARRLGLNVSQVAQRLHRARQRLREIVLAKLRDTVSEEAQVQEELLDLFGESGSA